jgi:serine/threonine protein kinase
MLDGRGKYIVLVHCGMIPRLQTATAWDPAGTTVSSEFFHCYWEHVLPTFFASCAARLPCCHTTLLTWHPTVTRVTHSHMPPELLHHGRMSAAVDIYSFGIMSKYCTVLYCIVLYCIVLYCIVLYHE